MIEAAGFSQLHKISHSYRWVVEILVICQKGDEAACKEDDGHSRIDMPRLTHDGTWRWGFFSSFF